MTEKSASNDEQGMFLGNPSPTGGLGRHRLPFGDQIVTGANMAAELWSKKVLLSEDEVVRAIIEEIENVKSVKPITQKQESKDLIVSFRAAFSGLVISLVDSAPSEIALVTLTNMNAIATWDVQRTTDSTIYITVTGFQIDNMVPNAPFPVAVCPLGLPQALTGNRDDNHDNINSRPPLLVVGLSFTPRHKSGIVVSFPTAISVSSHNLDLTKVLFSV